MGHPLPVREVDELGREYGPLRHPHVSPHTERHNCILLLYSSIY